jgi:alpha-beta hydrolase superfamily lysophospholipase
MGPAGSGAPHREDELTEQTVRQLLSKCRKRLIQPARRLTIRVVRQVLLALAYGVGGGTLVLIVGAVIFLNSRPDLSVWHTADLDAEFSAKSRVASFKEYLDLEERLFKQLDERVYARIRPEEQASINRYYHGSLSDPRQLGTNWNRSFELTLPEPKFGVLLLHGMSDSPYSLRSLGQRLNAAGGWAIGLRLPGHGTAPVGLTRVTWEDMAGAVRLAMAHLRERMGDRPLYIVGYSNGGALAMEYSLAAAEDASLPRVRGVVLISPEIGITRLAGLAVWQERIGRVLGLDKLKWNSIAPEYDPFKYGSFAVNAGNQAYRLTAEVQSRITRLAPAGGLAQVPPILAFQSLVDATVSTPALIEGLFGHLPLAGHEVVLFDINRVSHIEPVLQSDPKAEMAEIIRGCRRQFVLTVLTNRNDESREVVIRRFAPEKNEPDISETGLEWPRGIYSLSHVALPFPENDPVYGPGQMGDTHHVRLGELALRGERGVLSIPAADMLRLRWNPFYPYLERRVLEFMGITGTLE